MKGIGIFVTGGFIRNTLIGLSSKDVDLSSALKPNELIDLCNDMGIRSVLTGIKYGTVSIVLDSVAYEVTTFRSEGSYNGRRPKYVRFISSLRKDALRRDFTFNSLY